MTASPYHIWLIGDTGAVRTDGDDPVLMALEADLKTRPGGCVVVLGDLLYPKGMPETDDPGRQQAEEIIRAQTRILSEYSGTVFFLSGNHDWKKGSSSGWKNLRRLESFINQEMDSRDVCVPLQPGPGPEVREIFPGFHLVILNTQWWMQPGSRNPFRAAHFYQELEKTLERLSPTRTLVCGHHPIRSHSLHGGKFRKRHHLYPLSFHGLDNLPLPGVGSLWLMYRKFVGAREDMASSRYTRFREMLLELFELHPGITYASGHEHNLQWIHRDGIHHLISGAGSKSYYVKQGKGTRFASQHKGFFRLEIGEGGIERIQVFEQLVADGPVEPTLLLDWN